METEAHETYYFSRIDKDLQDNILSKQKDAVALSIQMGFVNDSNDKQHCLAFVTSTDSKLIESVEKGEISLDCSLERTE